MIYSKGSTVFLKSIYAFNKVKDHRYIYNLLKEIIDDMGQSNVVQILTDNGSTFVKAGKKLMERYNLYWTCYIPDFCVASVAYKLIFVLSYYVII